MLARAQKLIAEQLGVEERQVTLQAKFVEDLKADSLDIVEMAMAIEDEFGIEIPYEYVEGFLTVSDVMRYLTKRVHCSRR